MVGLWLLGTFFLSQGLYMDVKAKVAQILISSSWNQRNEGRPPPKPWWWADTRAIAKIEVPRLQATSYVMQDESGESLAFGPGHLVNSSLPGESGHVMIAGHRDSHFSFLRDIEIGDLIDTSNYQANNKRYRVTDIRILDTTKEELWLIEKNQLTLITCYPFDDFIPGGPLRLIVNAKSIEI